MNIEDAMPCHEMSLNSTFLILQKKKKKKKKKRIQLSCKFI